MEKAREDVCGCCGKGTNNPHQLRLMEMVEKAGQRADEKRKAEAAKQEEKAAG